MAEQIRQLVEQKRKREDKRTRGAPWEGTKVVWPSGLERRWGISPVTRWRWEKSGRIPPRDVNIGGKKGWKTETIVAVESARKQGC